MSKIKDELQRIRETEFDQYVSYMEWVCDQEMSESNTKEEQEDSNKPSSPRTSIVHHNTLKPVNNIDYYPKLGA